MSEVMPGLEDIDAFLRVLKAGSFVAAGRSLDIEPAAVSKRVARLESVLKVRLFARTTRRVTPTTEGYAYARRVVEAMRLLEQGREEVRERHTSLTGLVRITAPNPFGRRYIAQAIAAFRRLNPGVEFDLRLSDQVVDLVAGNFDLAIRIGDSSAGAFAARRIAINQQILCASPTYLAANGTLKRPDELSRHRFLAFVASRAVQEKLSLVSSTGKRIEIPVSALLRSDSGEVLREWAIAGEGISLRSTWDVVDELASGGLVRVLEEWKAPEQGIYALRPHRTAPQRVIKFVRFLAAHFANPVWDRTA